MWVYDVPGGRDGASLRVPLFVTCALSACCIVWTQHNGMHKGERGAKAIIVLRCAKPSGRLEDSWERRAQPSSHAA